MAFQETAKYWVDYGAATTASLAKILLLSKPGPTKLPIAERNKLVILGNGPSLMGDMPSLKEHRAQADFLGVNVFGQTPAYEQLKPNHYLMLASEFWDRELDADYLARMDAFYEDFSRNTDWPVNLLLPFQAGKSMVIKNLLNKQPLFRAYYFNTTPVEGFEGFRHWAYARGLGMPRPQNVLIPSIMAGIRMGYREIYLYGADHSWLPEIRVAEDNTVFLTQKHFYDYQSAQAKPMRKAGRGQRKLHEVLHKFYHSFRAYSLIREYADSIGTQIYNSTKGSFIDAFERKVFTTQSTQ